MSPRAKCKTGFNKDRLEMFRGSFPRWPGPDSRAELDTFEESLPTILPGIIISSTCFRGKVTNVPKLVHHPPEEVRKTFVRLVIEADDKGDALG